MSLSSTKGMMTEEEMEIEIQRLQQQNKQLPSGIQDEDALSFGSNSVGFDPLLYSDQSQYDMSIPVNEDDINEEVEEAFRAKLPSYTAPKNVLDDIPGEDVDPFQQYRRPRIIDRETDYHKRRYKRTLSPSRGDAYKDNEERTYAEVFKESRLRREEEIVRRQIEEKEKKEFERESRRRKEKDRERRKEKERSDRDKKREKKRDSKYRDSRKDRDSSQEYESRRESSRSRRSRDYRDSSPTRDRDYDRDYERDYDRDTKSSRKRSRERSESRESRKKRRIDEPTGWEKTPVRSESSRWDETPVMSKSSRWDETPVMGSSSRWDQTPTTKRSSRWDETPADLNVGGVTPVGADGMKTPVYGDITQEQIVAKRWERDIAYRNRPLSDSDLDEMLPSEGFVICEPPPNYVPIRTPARKLLTTPDPYGGTDGFFVGEEGHIDPNMYGVGIVIEEDLPEIKPEDKQYFEPLLDGKEEEDMTADEAKDRKIMKLLLKVKNGTPPQRKQALRLISEKAKEFGPAALFNRILPLLMSPTLEDQERHLLVKVIDRIMYKLDDLVRPYVHKILVVIEPLLIDEDYYARVEGREIISNLAKAAGLATMIAVMRPDIDNEDEYVRNTTARAFAVVASALGIPSLLPFLKAVCKSKNSWQARHTGIKIVQHIAILMGCAVLPHLRSLVAIIEHGLKDPEQKVRTNTALAIASLAEAAAPYGIESFDSVLRPLWLGIREHRSKALAAFLKAIGYIIPLMDAEYASYYTQEVMTVLIREFASPDEEMKKIVLKVVKQCVSTEGVTATYVREEIMEPFFKHFWVRRMALDRRNYRELVETTLSLAIKVGAAEIITRIVYELKDYSEPYRKMVCETIDRIITTLGVADIGPRLEQLLFDGILYCFEEQISDDSQVVLNSFGTIVNALGLRCKLYFPQIAGVLRFRLTSKVPKIRQQAADLISRIAMVMMQCGEEKLLGHIGKILYEYLGEEFPEVLGSILGALKAIVNVIGMTKMNPPIKELLPRLTPILKNRHEKVQENCIDLVGRIADKGAEYTSAKEWMRICFELLEMLKAHKKGIRRATVNTFGYIAKAIGPQDVLATLLNNLRVQERRIRVCTTVAIAIVAETCAPFTVIPALMNEYRVPENNVQNGVLKALSFLFEYIGEMGKDYIYAVIPLLTDALQDRDVVHRQTACVVVKHMALGSAGLGCEDGLIHLLNFIWPNIFESSPHLHNAVTEAIEGCRVACGPSIILNYLLQGLFHPARKVRAVYWKVYNFLYIGDPDGMVPSYPRLPPVKDRYYDRQEFEMFI